MEYEDQWSMPWRWHVMVRAKGWGCQGNARRVCCGHVDAGLWLRGAHKALMLQPGMTSAMGCTMT